MCGVWLSQANRTTRYSLSRCKSGRNHAPTHPSTPPRRGAEQRTRDAAPLLGGVRGGFMSLEVQAKKPGSFELSAMTTALASEPPPATHPLVAPSYRWWVVAMLWFVCFFN